MDEATLEEYEELIADSFIIGLNANDLWAWALADMCVIDAADVPKYLEAARRFGTEGKFAFMSVAESQHREQPLHPMPEWFDDSDYAKQHESESSINRGMYTYARHWILGRFKGNNAISSESGYRSPSQRDQHILELRRENNGLRKDNMKLRRMVTGTE